MNKITVGIDPDSKTHGVAVYVNSKLGILKCLTLIDAITLIRTYKNNGDSVTVHIEDVCANSAVFIKKGANSQGAIRKVSNSVGRCQQSQVELMRMLEHYNVEYKLHGISKRWKKEKSLFEKLTNWTGRSNEDTRSAAYFGFLGLK